MSKLSSSVGLFGIVCVIIGAVIGSFIGLSVSRNYEVIQGYEQQIVVLSGQVDQLITDLIAANNELTATQAKLYEANEMIKTLNETIKVLHATEDRNVLAQFLDELNVTKVIVVHYAIYNQDMLVAGLEDIEVIEYRVSPLRDYVDVVSEMQHWRELEDTAFLALFTK